MKTIRQGNFRLALVAGLNLLIVICFWAQNSGPQLFGEPGDVLIAAARLCGLIGTLLVLGQVLMISRVRWLESKIGFDRVTRYHRANGKTLIYLLLAHPVLLSFGYGLKSQADPISQFLELLSWQYVLWALIALTIFTVLATMAAVRVVRSKLSYEQWYYTHLFMYVAILLVFFHQIANGADFVNPIFRLYWYGIYIFAFANLIYFRFFKQLANFAKYRFRIEKVEAITPSANSIYIGGRGVKRFKRRPGQFVMVYFLARRYWWQKHPFTVSIEPGHDFIRLSVKGVGDFTKTLGKLPVGTRVLVDGPYGIFTPDRTKRRKVLMIAGGSGITPIRAMLPEMLSRKRDVILLYGNRSKAETMLASELDELTKSGLVWHNVLSEDPEAKGEQGIIDQEKIARLVPDLTERDVYLCGPPVMMEGLLPVLEEMGLPPERIYSERFSL